VIKFKKKKISVNAKVLWNVPLVPDRERMSNSGSGQLILKPKYTKEEQHLILIRMGKAFDDFYDDQEKKVKSPRKGAEGSGEEGIYKFIINQFRMLINIILYNLIIHTYQYLPLRFSRYAPTNEEQFFTPSIYKFRYAPTNEEQDSEKARFRSPHTWRGRGSTAVAGAKALVRGGGVIGVLSDTVVRGWMEMIHPSMRRTRLIHHSSIRLEKWMMMEWNGGVVSYDDGDALDTAYYLAVGRRE
jgi:hypothetical protein